MTKKRGENKDSSKTENYEKKQPSAFLVSMLPFQGLVLTSLFQATRSFVCFSSTFNHNIGSSKLIYMKESLSVPRYVILLFYYIFRVLEIYIYKECYYLMLRWVQSHVFCSLDVDQLVQLPKFCVSISTFVFFILKKYAMVSLNLFG